MNPQIHDRDRKNQQKTSSSSTNLDLEMPQIRSFAMQLKMRSQLPDLKTSLSQAERYGHHLDKIQLASISSGTPIQMLSTTEEEQNKLMLSVDLGVSKLTGNKEIMDTAFNIKKRLKKLNTSHQKDTNTNSSKHFVPKITSLTETSTSKNKGKEKNYDEHLTSPTIHKNSEKAIEDTSLPQDPEVTRLLNKNSKNNLPGLGSGIQEKNQENFIAPPSTYNKDKNAPPPKAGTHSQLLAKKEAMNLLGDNKGFATTQRAVKISVGDKAKDKQHQVKLKDAAELVRDRVIKDDRQVKEHLRGNFNLEPDIVAKEGGEELILQEVI